jgi:glycosyltransferase involved in cell wall biosynthesis
VIRNYPEDLAEAREAPAYDERANRVVYAGGLTLARGVEQMVDAMEHADLPADWRLLLVGPHSPGDLIDRLRARPGWVHVDHRSEVSPTEARRLMSECRIGLALLQPIGQYVDVLPTKLFEYMSLAIPVVASDYPQCREVVDGARCGLLVEPTDPKAIGVAIAELAGQPDLAREMGENGRVEGARRFNWASEEQRLLAVYSGLVGPGTAGLPA